MFVSVVACIGTLLTNLITFHLLRNCSNLWTVDLGIVLPKEGFNTMAMNFVMMWVFPDICTSFSHYSQQNNSSSNTIDDFILNLLEICVIYDNKLQNNVIALINPDSPFCFVQIRNVNTKRCLGELPSFLFPILERISSCPTFKNADPDRIVLDQLTVW